MTSALSHRIKEVIWGYRAGTELAPRQMTTKPETVYPVSPVTSSRPSLLDGRKPGWRLPADVYFYPLNCQRKSPCTVNTPGIFCPIGNRSQMTGLVVPALRTSSPAVS
ncbi:hypothetical protein NHX12_005284 [Muraenolepis orangiensis]|uniref:Uncharacterized protein n=1 Tax=Muraenolepis orangiensis TaxID=630683 RepID=A0A9Q0IDK1_9TELE|nr:hypothetical protein NHX12_005284 [Muraenolepis orangiensis]